MIRACGLSAVLLLLGAVNVWAADWSGHTQITYEVATSRDFRLPEDLARVLAVGSVAPDFFEFNNPAAHAQTPTPLIRQGRLAVTEHEYASAHVASFSSWARWHDFYFNAAVDAMYYEGRREQAAFLLAYALHSTQDLGTHQGLPNIAHAAWDHLGSGPDRSKDRLRVAREVAARDLREFRRIVGPDAWRLFVGESVGGKHPEPLRILAPALKDWDPRQGLAALATGRAPVRPESEPSEIDLLNSFFRVFYAWQDPMLTFLDVKRRQNDPPLPRKKALSDIAAFTTQVFDYKYLLPRLYQSLPSNEQRLLASTQWRKALAELIESKKRRRAELEAQHRNLRVEQARIDKEREEWRARPHLADKVVYPTYTRSLIDYILTDYSGFSPGPSTPESSSEGPRRSGNSGPDKIDSPRCRTYGSGQWEVQGCRVD